MSWLKRGQQTMRLCLDVCSVNCEVLQFLHHFGKLTLGLIHVASATKQRSI